MVALSSGRPKVVSKFIEKLHFPIAYNNSLFTGKTTLMCELIRHRDEKFNTKIKRIIYLYSYLSKDLLDLKKKNDDMFLVNNIDAALNLIVTDSLLILDDQICSLKNKPFIDKITELFVATVHHKKCSVYLLLQNLYFCAAVRTLALNSGLLLLMNCVRDKTIAMSVAKAFSPHNTRFVLDAYKKAILSKQRGYLVIDLSQDTPERFRLTNSLGPSSDMEVYVEI